MTLNSSFNTVDILSTLPHRYPFLLIDRVTDFIPNTSCTGVKQVTMNEPFFVGHFPGRPVMPGVLQVEAMAQTGIFLGMKSASITHSDAHVAFGSIDSCKFLKPVFPGSEIHFNVNIKKKVNHIYVFSCTSTVKGEVMSECELKGVFTPAHEYTLSMIKPDAVRNHNEDDIIQLLKANGLEIAIQDHNGIHVPMKKRLKLTKDDAKSFYAVHAHRPFFNDLCEFMSSGECVVMVLKGKNAVEHYRNLMGATNPKDAAEGTIRKMYATSIDENAVHGSDSQENAKTEINFFFPGFIS